MDYTELDRVRCELVKASELWQFDVMKPQKLVQFAKDRKIFVFNEHTLKGLWQAGLLRADAVTSKARIEVPSLTMVGEENGIFLYCDMRPVPHRREGYGGVFSKKQTQAPLRASRLRSLCSRARSWRWPKRLSCPLSRWWRMKIARANSVRPDPTRFGDLELYFHPFRLYVLYHVDRVFDSMTVSTQYLQYPEGIISASKRQIEHLDHWTSSEQCAQRFEYWNRVAELAIALEPVAYSDVFHSIRWKFPNSLEDIEAKRDKHRESVKSLLTSASREEIERFRQDLCQSAEVIDDNKMVHVLLRLMSGNERLKVRSSLGAAMLLLNMAEIIRRAAEEASSEQFPEEDVLGFGQWMDGARKSIYGSERILDAPGEVRREFLTRMGLDFGVKIKCYLEGETEVGALTSAGDAAGAEFINLRGQVVERKGKGLAFVESLQNDKRLHVFSLVMIDADNVDNVRALKKAAKDGNFFGRFFIANPDFEFANFTVGELVDVVLTLGARTGQPVPARDEILSHLQAAKTAKEFFAALKNTNLYDIDKNRDWGVELMTHAIEHPQLPNGHKHASKTRPVFEAAQIIVSARQGAGYLASLERFTVDPETGELRRK